MACTSLSSRRMEGFGCTVLITALPSNRSSALPHHNLPKRREWSLGDSPCWQTDACNYLQLPSICPSIPALLVLLLTDTMDCKERKDWFASFQQSTSQENARQIQFPMLQAMGRVCRRLSIFNGFLHPPSQLCQIHRRLWNNPIVPRSVGGFADGSSFDLYTREPTYSIDAWKIFLCDDPRFHAISIKVPGQVQNEEQCRHIL